MTSGTIAQRRDAGLQVPFSLAASDATSWEKLLSRRFCNGVNDADKLKEAFDNDKVVYLTSGTYVVDDFLAMVSNLTIVGPGSGICTIKVKDSSSFTQNKGLFDFNSVTNIHVSGLTLDGNKANNTNGTYDGVMSWSSDHLWFDDVWCNNFPDSDGAGTAHGDGFAFTSGGSPNVPTTWVWLNRCGADGNVRVGFLTADGEHIFHDFCVSKNQTGTVVAAGYYLEGSGAGADNIDIHYNHSVALDNRSGWTIAPQSGSVADIFLGHCYGSGNSAIADFDFRPDPANSGWSNVNVTACEGVFNITSACLDAGGVKFNQVSSSRNLAANTNLTLTAAHDCIFVTTGGTTDNTITLPSAGAAILGRRFTVYVVTKGAKNCVVNRAGSDVFTSGATTGLVSATLDAADEYVEFLAVGTAQWLVITSQATLA